MGSSGSGGGDCNIGPIVWVRRRNGSWWPGKILGPDELSEGNLTSPRTGTPVKLLGREDASVDWYNLEKSKRVKPFRCGEFDDCIERAESANGMPIKKREKYARREDAILHALELEKQLLKKQENFSATSDQLRSKSSESTKEPSVCSDGLATNIGKSGNTNLNQRLNAVDSGINDEVVGSAINTKEENQSISEDDHCEATPRIKGLQDLGLKTAPLKRKFPWPVVSNGSDKPMLDNDIQANLVGGPGMERRNDANGEEHVASFYRAKRSRCNYLLSESNDSLDDQEILSKQNKMFPSELKGDDDHAHHHALSNEQNSSSGFMEDIESDSSETVASDFESDSSLTEPHMDEEMTDFQDTALSSEAEGDALSQRDAHGSTSTEEVDELTFPGSLQHFYPEEPFPGNETVSKWQLKGKRNIRTLSKRSSDGGDGKISTTSPQNYHGQYFNGVDLSRKYFGSQSVGPYASRFLSKGRNHYDWGEMMWDDPMENLNPIIFSNHHFGGRPRPVLIDVDLQVQASYKRGVPIVSLTSKYNGKAIIGHPIQTEPLEDDSPETLVSINAIKAIENDGTSPVQPAWRTSRRTNLRVPRLRLEDPLWVEQEDKFRGKKPNGGQKAGGGRKSRFTKKPPKRASLLGNQKTRTLSSIAGEHKFGVKAMQPIDGLIKPQTTTVACIPVKLVFSRLLEKINRAPLK